MGVHFAYNTLKYNIKPSNFVSQRLVMKPLLLTLLYAQTLHLSSTIKYTKTVKKNMCSKQKCYCKRRCKIKDGSQGMAVMVLIMTT